MRAAAGIKMRNRAYPQVAFTATVQHTRPHEDTSTEFHTESGPFTLVPLTGDRSSIVCVVTEREAIRLLGLSDEALARELEARASSVLGRFEMEGGRGAFPAGGGDGGKPRRRPHRALERSRPHHARPSARRG